MAAGVEEVVWGCTDKRKGGDAERAVKVGLGGGGVMKV